MALMIFLLFSRFFSFRTIRERMEWGGNMRYKRDFLEFVQDDVHYVVIALSQFLLFVYVLKHLTHEIDWTVTLAIVFLCCRYAFSFAAIFYVYFYSKANGKRKKIKVLSYFLGTLITSGVMLFCFAQDLRQKLYWWPFVLQDIVLNFFILLNIIVEVVLLPKKVQIWKKQFFVMKALNQLEINELLNQQMTRQNKHEFDEKEQVKLAEKILQDEKVFKQSHRASKNIGAG